jgi:hypothetical protein
MTPVKMTTAVAVLVLSGLGFVLLAAAVPAERRLTMYFDERVTDEQTLRYGRELLDNPIAWFIDPDGHNQLARALAIDARIAAGGHRELDEIDPLLDPTLATDHHQRGINQARIAGILTLALIFLGSLIGFILWVRDLRNGGWVGSTTLLGLALLPATYTFLIALPLALVLAPLWLLAIVTVGRQSMIVMRLRGPREL